MAISTGANDYDVSPLIRGVIAPLAAAGIDPNEALKDPEKAYAALEQQRQLGSGNYALAAGEPGYPSVAPVAPAAKPATVPASVSNSGRTEAAATPSPAAPFQPAVQSLASAASGYKDVAQGQQERLQRMAELLREKQQAQAGKPNENAPQYRPSIGRRIVRGLVGAGLGLAEHGLSGAAMGALAPQLTSGVGYNDPNSAFGKAMQAWKRSNDTRDVELSGLEAQEKAADEQRQTYGGLSETGGRQATVGKDISDATAEKPDKRTPQIRTYDDLMTGGENGGPQVNPDTGQPYTSQEALERVAQAGKPDVIAQRTQDADRMKLAGEDRKFFIANGKLREPSPTTNIRIPSEALQKYQDWRRQFRIDNKRDPNAQEIASYGKANGGRPASSWQFGRIEREKQEGLKKAEADFRLGVLTAEDLSQEKQRIQDEYEQQILNLGGAADHFEYGQPAAKAAATVQPATPQPQKPAGKPAQFAIRDGKGAKLDRATAAQYVQKAGGDKAKARQLAKQDNWKF